MSQANALQEKYSVHSDHIMGDTPRQSYAGIPSEQGTAIGSVQNVAAEMPRFGCAWESRPVGLRAFAVSPIALSLFVERRFERVSINKVLREVYGHRLLNSESNPSDIPFQSKTI